MKAIVSGLAALARKAPWAVIIVSLILTGVFGYLAGQVEVASGNEGFAPDSPEIAASERISELFGDATADTALQVVIRDEGGDVITAEGLRTAIATAEAIRASAVGDLVADQPQRPGVFHYLSGVEQAVLGQGLDPNQVTDEQVKAMFIEAIDGDGEFDASPEQVSFLTQLASQDLDPAAGSAEAGMVLAFVSPPPGDADASFNAQVEAESSMAEDLAAIDSELEILPFSFALLLTGTDDFTAEVGELFALAFAVILVILIFVYWLKPEQLGWARATRRTLADTLVTLLAIVMAIGWMQGIGVLLERAGIIDAFSAPTQIVPILLIGLGVDYGIHLNSRYREEIGEGLSVDDAMGGAIRTVGIALVLATLTTVIGFLTNVFSPIPALKDFGILSAVGILAAFLLMLVFLPTVRIVADRRAERRGTLPVATMHSHGDRLLPKAMEKLAILAEHAAIPTLVIALALGGLGWYGFTQLETRFSFTDFLPADSPYVLTLEVLEEDFGGGLGETSQVLVETAEGETVDAALHNALVDANADLAGVEDVATVETAQGEVVNAVSPIAVLGQALAGDPAAAPDLFAAAQEVGMGPDLKVDESANVGPLYEALLAFAPEQAAQVIHLGEEGIDALLWDITTTAGEGPGELRVGLDDAFQPARDTGASATATSQNIIGDVVVNSLTSSQSASLFITIAVSALVLVISFAIENRRWFLGIITMAPVGLVVLWTYGLMYATGIPFGPVTATLAALAIGIGVPYTIHIARRFLEDRREQPDADEAMRLTMRHTGGALAGSAFTTMAGFGVLITSSLIPFRQMGQVTVYAIGLALIAAVVVLPSMLTLWDRYHQRRGNMPAAEPKEPAAPRSV
ncbi:MAG: efflux RND transporter permease subunit [Acidimicrobiia bacterium]